MKSISLISTFLISLIIFSQNNNQIKQFSFTSEGLNTNEIEVKMKGMDKEDLIEKAKKWIKEKYGNLDVINKQIDTGKETDEVEKGKKDKKINFDGFTDNAICFGLNSDYSCFDATYEIELEFDDDEYIFIIDKLEYEIPGNKKDQKIKLNKSDFHYKDGDLIGGYEKVPTQIENLFNNLNKSLFNYLSDFEQETEW